jgi:hypothetical protein
MALLIAAAAEEEEEGRRPLSNINENVLRITLSFEYIGLKPKLKCLNGDQQTTCFNHNASATMVNGCLQRNW